MKVVLKHAGRWLHFERPERVLVAERIEDVVPMLAEAEASGLHAAGFVSYEAAPAFDAALKTRAADFPLLYLGLFQPPVLLDDIEVAAGSAHQIGAFSPSISKERFVADIAAIKDHIAAGATYQVNHTYRLGGGFSGDAWAFFHALIKGQRTEHAAFVETEDFAICSASPELFFEIKEGVITSRPMKGTARRGLTLAEDWKQAEALQRSVKDRAENIMIVDMIRNDIGRVAVPGSVETLSVFDVEKYPTVWQMTSTVRGRLKEDVSLVDVFSALFPCSSITGAPKTKTMEIIAELETSPRGVYTGAIGFAAPNGEACFNVAIRTAVTRGGRLEFGVGGGIVWDSAAESEYEETLTKARVLTQPRPDFQLLETMLWEPETGVYLLNQHLQRLGKSAAYFDIPLRTGEIVAALSDEFHTSICVKSRVRLLVSRDGSHEFQIDPIEEDAPRTRRVAVARSPVDVNDVFLYHKTTNRRVYEKAKADFPELDDVILWNERGEVTESAIANVVIRRGDKRITPPVDSGLLAGTFRDHLLKAGGIEEGVVTLEELWTADEVFLVNSVRKWQKVVVEQQEI